MIFHGLPFQQHEMRFYFVEPRGTADHFRTLHKLITDIMQINAKDSICGKERNDIKGFLHGVIEAGLIRGYGIRPITAVIWFGVLDPGLDAFYTDRT